MNTQDYNRLSNAEIKIKLIEMEHEYEVTQNKIKQLTEHLMSLNEEYIKGKKIYNKRTKGML